ncbi:uncharacterized protein LOC116425861 [Nomia melanderi]|uniref:uncharacterized protein LOC116425861 n=1 Tax=Nomia melanderi TaxID=2448451 RepID=UPI0013046663|nr:uncharacterized protein LOC116425861 [Nomia melanderi]XP_031829958.1 uncharacterized protein LOC116425861 [Nomia melanderi]XP_031829959.1 uncharacterized protein LOC116425861 [Nomia melanderi]XP_031829960.1 uncharacterized protein LOC116425861 [Nomia melanderi]
MATDIEESDTDDHERPAPSKRQCTRLIKVNETVWEENKNSDTKEETIEDPEHVQYEKLKKWQMCQVAKGFLDNTINKVLENYIMGAPPSYPLDESRFQWIRENDMEDTAVLMAIRNHGLVQSGDFVSQSNASYSHNTSEYWTNNEFTDAHYSCSSNGVENIENRGSSIATTSTNSIRLNNSNSTEEYIKHDWDLEKADDNDQQENFLERAVAEAIKKKGLTALSIDYG